MRTPSLHPVKTASKALPKRRQADGRLCGLELVPAWEQGSSCDSKRCQPNQAPSWDRMGHEKT